MNRRGFLKSMLGVAAGTALPAPALKFLADSASLADAAFREQAIINLVRLRIATLHADMKRMLDEKIYAEGTSEGGLSELIAEVDNQGSAVT